jgi:effector-binding domain-containing protein
MLKKILLGLIALIVLLAGIGFLLPRQSHVERSVTIDRPASLVYATVNSFQRFAEWSPWQELDPNMTVTMEGPRSGVGAKYSWSGNDKVGVGTQTISASVENESVTNDLDFGDMGLAKAMIKLAPEGAGTKVRWMLDSDMGSNPIGRYFGLMMDSMVGKDYERGLGKLKALVEQLPNVDIKGFAAEETELQPQTILVVTKTTTTDTAAISKAYAEAYGEIGKFMAKNKLQQAGAPLGIDREMTADSFSFDAAIPVDRTDVVAGDGVQVTQSYAGRALKTTHVGPYEKLSETYAKFEAYAKAHAYTPAGGVISWYLDDPANTPPDKLRTEMYWPIK